MDDVETVNLTDLAVWSTSVKYVSCSLEARAPLESHTHFVDGTVRYNAIDRQVVVVSHRWVSPHNLDVNTRDWRAAESHKQLKAIRAFLTEHTEIFYECRNARRTPAKESQGVMLARNGFHCLHIG